MPEDKNKDKTGAGAKALADVLEGLPFETKEIIVGEMDALKAKVTEAEAMVAEYQKQVKALENEAKNLRKQLEKWVPPELDPALVNYQGVVLTPIGMRDQPRDDIPIHGKLSQGTEIKLASVLADTISGALWGELAAPEGEKCPGWVKVSVNGGNRHFVELKPLTKEAEQLMQLEFGM